MPTQSKPALGDIDGLERSLTAKARKAISLEDFAWPEERKFPIDSQAHLDSAATLIGHAPEAQQAQIKARAKAIAKSKGFTLPQTWQDEDSKAVAARADAPDSAIPDDPLDDILGNPEDEDAEEDEHAIMDSIEGAEGGEDRSMPSVTIERAMPTSEISYYAPITRIDKEKREVIGTATAEVKDAYRTVIGYEASKDAFARWPGNIREMHQNKAVGRALEIIPDDENRRIIVRARISKGAQDTWEKVLDGTLTGFSIGGKNGVWSKRIIDGEELPYLERYDQAELSVVDNPACPKSSFEVVRADGMASEILASESEMETTKPKNARTPGGDAATIERAGARISQETQDAMHDSRNHQILGAIKTMKTCGCDQCTAACQALDPDEDDDIDFQGLYDPDGDAAQVMADRAVVAVLTRELKKHIASEVQAALAPGLQRINALLATDASRTESPEITRRSDEIDAQLAAIKVLVEKIAGQPVDGGPVLHGAPMDKRLALQGNDQRNLDDVDILRRAMELGFAPPSSPEAQVLAASKFVRR